MRIISTGESVSQRTEVSPLRRNHSPTYVSKYSRSLCHQDAQEDFSRRLPKSRSDGLNSVHGIPVSRWKAFRRSSRLSRAAGLTFTYRSNHVDASICGRSRNSSFLLRRCHIKITVGTTAAAKASSNRGAARSIAIILFIHRTVGAYDVPNCHGGVVPLYANTVGHNPPVAKRLCDEPPSVSESRWTVPN